jgi:hypothetical protein
LPYGLYCQQVGARKDDRGRLRQFQQSEGGFVAALPGEVREFHGAFGQACLVECRLPAIVPGVHTGWVNILADRKANIPVAVTNKALHTYDGSLFKVRTDGRHPCTTLDWSMSTLGIPWTGMAATSLELRTVARMIASTCRDARLRVFLPLGFGVRHTGMGLRLMRMAVGLAGGEVIIDSRAAAGTCVTITLPLD